jgi:hypothetical protein
MPIFTARRSVADPGTATVRFWRWIAVVAGLGAAATVLAALSCWHVGWLSDDWVFLRGAEQGALLEEARHVSVPRRALWWAVSLGAGPWIFRLAGLACHLGVGLVLVPRLAGLLFPGWSLATRVLAGLVLLALPVTIEGLVWPAAVAYPILELALVVTAYAHLRWLRDGASAWRAGSVLGTAAALATWEIGVTAPLVVLILSLFARRGRRVLRDVAPHAALLVPWLAMKLALGSTGTLGWRGPVRMVGHVVATPLLALSPWPLDHVLLMTWPARALTAVVFGLAVAAAWRLGRTGITLLFLAWGVLTPVLLAPGPEARYLLLAAPWLALLATAAVNDLAQRAGRPGRIALALAFVVFCAGGGAASWWLAARWRTAESIPRGVVDGVVAASAADGRRDVVVIDAPDRMPTWGPTSKVPVWRHGLPEALAWRGVRLIMQAHTTPGDPDVLGLRPNTRPWTRGDVEWWRAQGWLVLACRRTDRGTYDIVRFAER